MEYIGINVEEIFKKAFKKYCKDRGISMSSVFKEMISSMLIKEGYLGKSEVTKQ